MHWMLNGCTWTASTPPSDPGISGVLRACLSFQACICSRIFAVCGWVRTMLWSGRDACGAAIHSSIFLATPSSRTSRRIDLGAPGFTSEFSANHTTVSSSWRSAPSTRPPHETTKASHTHQLCHRDSPDDRARKVLDRHVLVFDLNILSLYQQSFNDLLHAYRTTRPRVPVPGLAWNIIILRLCRVNMR